MTMPSQPTLHQEAAEAICSALFRTGFEAIGETEGGRVSWFHRGTKPKDVRVRVERSPLADITRVFVEWRNLANGTRLKGEQKFEVYAGPTTTREAVVQATQDVVIKVLEIFRDVLAEEGVAGSISELVDTDPEAD